MNKEGSIQKSIIDEIQNRLPGSMVFKMDAKYIQGTPDLLIIYNDRYAFLECKDSESAKHRPNQDYYIDKLNNMSYASFIYPENKEEVLNEVQRALQS